MCLPRPCSNSKLVLLNESGAAGAAFLGAREAGQSVRLHHSDFISVLHDCSEAHHDGPPDSMTLDATSAIGLFAASLAITAVRALAALKQS